MQQSESIAQLAVALMGFQGDVGAIPKTSTNPFFKSKYAGLPVVIETAQTYLTKWRLAVTQVTEGNGLTTTLLHESGEWISGTADLHLVKDDPQAHGSAITYMRRYGYMAILGLVADEDDDGNKGSGKGKDGEKKGKSDETKGTDERPLSPLWGEIKDDLKYQALGDGKLQFLIDTVGHDVQSPRDLSDSDCEQVIAALRVK